MTCLVAMLALVACESEPPTNLVKPERIDRVLRTYVGNESLVGVSALVYEKDKEVYFGAFGDADREINRPMQRDTLVQIYSMTKPVTGVVLMTLYEEGLFELDAPLSDYLPEFAEMQVYASEVDGLPSYEATQRPILVRDILRHTAGFSDSDDQSAAGTMFRETDPTNWSNTLAQLSEKLASVPLLYQPGTRWRYSAAVDIQARLAEVLGGKPYATLLQERVLQPLQMDDTQYRVSPEQRERMTAMYTRQDDGAMVRMSDAQAFAFNTNDWPLTPGTFGLVSSLDDYMRFARMLVNGGELDGVQMLQPETIKLMATDAMPAEVTDKLWLPNKGQVGFGIDFAVRIAPPVDQAEASGVVGEFFWDGLANTLFWVDPENDIAAVLFLFYMPFGKIEIQKDFRDAVYFDDEVATARNKAPATESSRRLSD